jgi:hypothetical protein
MFINNKRCCRSYAVLLLYLVLLYAMCCCVLLYICCIYRYAVLIAMHIRAHAPCTIHHTPSTVRHAPCTMHHHPLYTIHYTPCAIPHHPLYTIHHHAPSPIIHHPPSSTIHTVHYAPYTGPRAGIQFDDGFNGRNVVRGNLVFNSMRESNDGGPFNMWDRCSACYTQYTPGTLTVHYTPNMTGPPS